MKKNDHKELAGSLLRVIPTKWAIGIVVFLIAYVLLQPKLNQWFGWKLPSLASLLGEAEQPKPEKSKASKSTAVKAAAEENTAEKKTREKAIAEKESEKSTSDKKPSQSDVGAARSNGLPANKKETDTYEDEDSTPQTAEEFLTKIDSRRFESPAGLIYGPGSEEGHRLKHIERHLKDFPNREGSHGVFDGTMVEFLKAIDDVYTRAKRGDKGTKKQNDDGAIVFEAGFPKSIGYLGGQSGKRQKNPKLKKLRVVVRGDNVITAFPIP